MATRKYKVSLKVASLMIVGACIASSVHAQSSPLLFDGGFETGDHEGWNVSRDNVPVVQSKKVRAGRYALMSPLKFFNGEGASPLLRERTEVRAEAPSVVMGREYWYGFSIYLPGPEDGEDNYVPDKYWEIVSQWYAPPDDSTESGRIHRLCFRHLRTESVADGFYKENTRQKPSTQRNTMVTSRKILGRTRLASGPTGYFESSGHT